MLSQLAAPFAFLVLAVFPATGQARSFTTHGGPVRGIFTLASWLPGTAAPAYGKKKGQAAKLAEGNVLASTIPPGTTMRAVVYTDQPDELMLLRIGDKTHVVWQRRLVGKLRSLSSPGPAGLFQAVTEGPKPRAARLYAYMVRHGKVSSAVAGHPGGGVFGDEGVAPHSGGFDMREHDWHHVGSVRYRLITRYRWTGSAYRAVGITRVPDYLPDEAPLPNVEGRTRAGNTVLIKLRLAETEAQREQGLMYIKRLDPDTGMLFVWQEDTQDSFWMENTYIPLTVAFLASDGTIQEIQDMQPLTTALHTPARPYRYALEVNQGFFAKNGIQIGDRFALHLG